MEIRRTRRIEDNEKYLVADQPGKFIVFLGLMLSILLGFTVRGLLNPVRVEELLRQAANQVHKQVKIEFSNARVSLHLHGFPRFAVIVDNVIVNADQPCWMSPKLKTDQMELPISFWNLIRGEGPIEEVRLGRVQLWLGEFQSTCKDGTQVVSEKPGTIGEVTPRIRIKDESSKIPDNPTDVRKITIDELSIFQDTYAKNGLYFTGIEVFAMSSQPLSLDVQGSVPLEKYFPGEELFGTMNVNLQYSEFPEKIVTWSLDGPLREGRVDIGGKVSLTNQNYELSAKLEHIPWVQFLRKENVSDDLKLLPRQSWLTAVARAADSYKDRKTYPLEIEELSVDGPQATFETKPFKIYIGQAKTTWDPIEMKIDQLELSPFMRAMGVKELPNILGGLGKFQGSANLKSEKSFEVNGSLSGLEFIFSNLGRRERQVVNFSGISIKRSDNQINADFAGLGTDVSPGAGNIKLTVNLDHQDLDAQMNFTNMRFSKNIEDLFLAKVGEKGITGNLRSHWHAGVVKFLRWELSLPSMTFRNLKAESARAQGFKNPESVSMHFAMNGLNISQSLLASYNAGALSDDGESLNLTTANISFKGPTTNNLSWSGSGDGPKDKIKFTGQWNEQNFLQGEIAVRGSKNLKGFIGGLREKPVVTWTK